MKRNQLYSFLSQLQLEKKVVFGNKDKEGYFINLDKKIEGFNKDVKQRIESIEPDAVYIFNSQPLILFFDLTEQNRDLDKLYKKVWSFDNTSIIFFIEKKEIKVFNALNYEKGENQNTLEKINLSIKEIHRLFNLWELESGKTWNWFQEKYIENKKGKNQKQRVNDRLFSNIKKVREDLKLFQLSENDANSLILRLIFIRYLIDRKIKIDDKLIAGKVDDLNERRKSFIQLIKQPQQLNELFKILNDRFNGVLFKETDVILTSVQAEYLSDVFSGEIDKNGLFKDFFFEVFDFSIIPVEVISGVYESLIDPETQNETSAIYTPSFLVDYILEGTVDKFLENHKPEECTVFEVAVGSGIFLVQSLRRIIEKEIEINGSEDNKAFAEKIKGYAENNLYGIDINEQALKVTCFSIYIALLDYLEPKNINAYKFPELLGKNLFKANFFNKEHIFNEVINSIKPKFILGNPPWKNGKKDKEHLEYITNENLLNVISDFQISQSFVLRTKDFKDFEPTCSLIITSKAVHNGNAKSFRDYFLMNNLLISCLDLSPVRRFVFSNKINPAIILNFKTAKNRSPQENLVKHSSLKSNVFLKNFKILVIEKFDQKEILQKHFIENNWMFKVALYGNTLDFHFLKKLEKIEPLNVFLNDNKILCGNGIKKGTPKKHFNELIGLPIAESKYISSYLYLKPKNISVLEKNDVYLEAGRNVDLFKGPKILLKKRTINESKISISYTPKDIVFKDSVNALRFNRTNEKYLEWIYNTIISNLYTYYQYITCSSWGVYYPEIHKSEFLNFPFLEPSTEYKDVFKELFQKFIEPLFFYYEKQIEKTECKFELKIKNREKTKLPVNQTVLNQINDIINHIYEVKEHEKDLIDYVLNVSRYQFQESKQGYVTSFEKFGRNKDKILTMYAEVYINEFSEIYPDEFIQVEIFPLEHFIAMNFVTTKEPPEETIKYSQNKEVESVLKTLANTLSISQIVNTSDPTKNLFIQKDIKGFEEDSFYIIKPNEYKCWHRAMAWYDVAEFKEAIQKAELDEFYTEVE